MAVVARLSCISITSFLGGSSVKLQPVVPSDDPHNEEIKEFFAATPAGSVDVSGELVPDAGPGKQYYLYLEPVKGEVDPSKQLVSVNHVQLNGWATQVGLKGTATPGSYATTWQLSFTIRNEVAAEQFQPGGQFYVRLEPVPEGA